MLARQRQRRNILLMRPGRIYSMESRWYWFGGLVVYLVFQIPCLDLAFFYIKGTLGEISVVLEIRKHRIREKMKNRERQRQRQKIGRQVKIKRRS